MRTQHLKWVLLMLMTGCIETELEDPLPENLRIAQESPFLRLGETIILEAEYTDRDGLRIQREDVVWTSDNASVVSIEGNTATARMEGDVLIMAEAGGLTDSQLFTVLGEGQEISDFRSGSLRGTGYDISGDFELRLNEEDELILSVSNYTPDGPGPYFYLTNSTSNIVNGLSLGKASESGSYEINVSEIAAEEGVELGLFTYGVLMVWCEPFRVRLGFGEFD
jgi:hypothetical protein